MVYVVVFLLASGLSVLFSVILKKYAVSVGYIAIPQQDRWHRGAIPLGGGIAIYLSFLTSLSLTLGLQALLQRPYSVLLIAATGIFLLGLLDDWNHLRPHTKLLWQILIASFFISFGYELRLTSWDIVNFFITLFWIVGITNAFNLLDNMDGMAAGIALIALFFRFLIFLVDGSQEGLMFCLTMMGALLGFLLFNFPPASIFMGDAGSLFIGFFASTLVMTGIYPYTKALVSVLLLPVLILLIPIFDTALVTISRTLYGRPISRGGRDHISHRLVAVGLSERRTVLLMYGMSAISGTVAFILYQIGFSYSVMGLSILSLAFVCLGIYLHRVKIYPEETLALQGHTELITLMTNFPYKRQVGAMLGDVILIAVAYYSAYLLRFGSNFQYFLQEYVKTLPLVLVCQMISNYLFGLYRSSWRYASVKDLVAICKAIGMGAVASVALMAYLYGFHGSSRAVFVVYGMAILLMTAGFRLSFRLLDQLLTGESQTAKRILIYGAGDAGELLAREISRNRTMNMTPIGFLDDDPDKRNLEIHGVPVLGNIDCLQKALSTNNISEIVISTEKLNSQTYQTLATIAAEFGVLVRKLKITVQ